MPIARALFIGVLIAFTAACGPRTAPVTRPEWQTVAELARPRAFASAIALGSGKILVVGGLDNADPSVMNYESELIDPATGEVKVLPQKLLGRLHQSITLGWQDVVVVAGGVEWRDTYWSPVDRVDVFDSMNGKWRIGKPLREARSDHAATVLHDGRILVTGGNADTTLLRSTEIYDPTTDRWSKAAPMIRPRTQHSAVTLLDGRVLVMGGLDTDGLATNTTFIYDPSKDAWSHGPRMTVARIQHVTVLLRSGDVLLVGGDGAASGTSERFDFRSGLFVRSGTLNIPRVAAQGAALPDGRVVISGGLPPRLKEFTPLRNVELWDPLTGAWTDLPAAPTPRAFGSIVIVGGAVYQLSGTGDKEAAYRTIERLALN